MLFKVVANEDFFDTNPEARAIPEFCDCTSREMKYVALMHDYLSPFRDLPVNEDKYEQVLLTAGFKKEPDGSRLDKNARIVMTGKQKRVQQAIGKYNTMQYDVSRETLKVVDAHIEQIRSFIRKKKDDARDLKAGNEFVKELPSLLSKRNEIAQTLKVRDEVKEEEKEIIDEAKPLSTLDKINLKLHE